MTRLPPLFRSDATVVALRGFQQRASPLVHASPNSALIAVGGAVSCVGELLGENVGCEVAMGEPLVEFKDVTIEFPGIRFLGNDLSRWKLQ